MWCPHFRILGAAKMMSFVSLLLVGIMFPAFQAKQFTKCELSQVLKDMDGFGGIALSECEFPDALLHSILHLPLSSTLLFLSTFIQLSNNPLMCLSVYSFIILIHVSSLSLIV